MEDECIVQGDHTLCFLTECQAPDIQYNPFLDIYGKLCTTVREYLVFEKLYSEIHLYNDDCGSILYNCV